MVFPEGRLVREISRRSALHTSTSTPCRFSSDSSERLDPPLPPTPSGSWDPQWLASHRRSKEDNRGTTKSRKLKHKEGSIFILKQTCVPFPGPREDSFTRLLCPVPHLSFPFLQLRYRRSPIFVPRPLPWREHKNTNRPQINYWPFVQILIELRGKPVGSLIISTKKKKIQEPQRPFYPPFTPKFTTNVLLLSRRIGSDEGEGTFNVINMVYNVIFFLMIWSPEFNIYGLNNGKKSKFTMERLGTTIYYRIIKSLTNPNTSKTLFLPQLRKVRPGKGK